MMGVLVGPVVVILLYPLLKADRPLNVEARRIEWSQWLTFVAVLGLLASLGMENPTIIKLAIALYVAAFAYAIHARNWSLTLIMLGVAAVGLSVYAYLPIRAAEFPPINEGEPTSWEALKAVLTREQYGKVPVWIRQATLPAQVGMWWDYFRWQFARDFSPGIEGVTAVGFLAIGGLGAWRHWRADRRTAAAMTALVLTLTALLIFYLNFRYRYSPAADQVDREVRERDYFYIASFAVWGIWVGMGFATLMESIRDFFRERVPDESRRWALASPVLLLALIPLFGNRVSASRAGETFPRDAAVDLLNSVEPYGILVTAGDNDTFPLWYAQEVEHIREDVTVVNLSLGNTDWHLRQLQRRVLPTFDSAAAPAIYQGRSWPKPTAPLMSFTNEQLATLRLAYLLDQPTNVPLGPYSITLDPKSMGREYIERVDVAVLQIIRDHLGSGRPIYLSRTVGDYGERLGLGDYLEGHGFVRRIRLAPVVESDSVIRDRTLGFVNLPRTRDLLFGVYHSESAARRRPLGWIDRPSASMLFTYGLLYQAMAGMLAERDAELAARSAALADTIFNNTDPEILRGQ